MTNNNLIDKINKLKKVKNTVILSHYYQLPEVQDLSDFVGDSYYLSLCARKVENKNIIFAGVLFMAETAKILNPKCRIFIPDLSAGCSLSDSCNEEDLKNFLKKHPDHIVVTYINTSAKVKALSDIICTSSNAEKIISSIPINRKIIFIPDRNLGSYLIKRTGRDMILWNGVCHVHNQIYLENLLKIKIKYNDALIVSHPECNEQIIDISDFVGSTSQIISYCAKSKSKRFIIATETGILHQLKKLMSNKEFFIVPYDEACNCNDCNFMKVITPEKILNSLENEIFEINLDYDVIEKARKPLDRMMEITENSA